MSYREARELAVIRFELRERLLTQRTDGIDPLLARMSALGGDDPELKGEVERWQLRFELLGLLAIPAAA